MTTPDEFREEFNTLASERVSRHAETIRKDFIGMSAWLLKDILRRQHTEAKGIQRGDTLQFWATSSNHQINAASTLWRPTMSYMVEGPPQRAGIPRLRVHVPIPEGFRSDDMDEINDLPLPDAVYPERLMKQAKAMLVVGRYAITANECSVFEVRDANADIGPEVWALHEPTQRISTNLPAVAQMVEDLINWNLAPQSSAVIGQGEVTEL